MIYDLYRTSLHFRQSKGTSDFSAKAYFVLSTKNIQMSLSNMQKVPMVIYAFANVLASHRLIEKPLLSTAPPPPSTDVTSRSGQIILQKSLDRHDLEAIDGATKRAIFCHQMKYNLPVRSPKTYVNPGKCRPN